MYLPADCLTSNITIPTDFSSTFVTADSPDTLFRTCPLHDHLSSRHSVEDILQIVLKSRKTWKTLKGKSEAVWPPYLEAILLKALQEYAPDDSRETRMLGRYPMRNRFISDYIHSTTGKYRSAKQVGSRLQQLRDTPEGRELIDVLTRCYHTRKDVRACQCNARQPSALESSSSPSPSTISCDSSSASSSSDSPYIPTSSVMRSFTSSNTRQPAESRMPVYIDILPQHSHATSTARHIRNIDPTVTFVSPSVVNGKSTYIVLLDGAPVHMEDTTLDYVGPYFAPSTGQSSGDESVLYNTALVPKYWNVLCEAADPTLYTIVQDVCCVPDQVPDQEYARRPHPVRIFSAIYHFQYHSSADSAPSYNQLAADMPSRGSSVTSAFGDQVLQGSMLVDPTQTSFSTPSTYNNLVSEGLRTSTDGEQNLFDEPFMLDVNLESAFDELLASMDNSNTFFM